MQATRIRLEWAVMAAALGAASCSNAKPEGSGAEANLGAARLQLVGATWVHAAPMHLPRFAHTSTLLPNGKALIAAGATLGTQRVASTELFDPATGAWSDGEPLAVARYGHTATLLPSGKVLVVGGEPACEPPPPDPDDPNPPPPIVPARAAELYDPQTGAWSNAGELHTLRHSHAAVALADGRVLVAGGQDCLGNWLDSVEIYGTAEQPNGFIEVAPLHSARSLPASAVLKDGRVLIAGGQGVAYGSEPIDENAVSAELYDPSQDPATATWKPTAGAMKYWDRSGATASVLPDGRVLVVGMSGAGSLPNNVVPVVNGAELYDPRTDSWSFTGTPMTVARVAPGIVTRPNGDVWVIGGGGPQPPFLTNPTPPPHYPALTELYSAAQDSWSAAGELVEGVQTFGLVVLADGKVLLTGGTTATDLDIVNKTQITSKLGQGAPCSEDEQCATAACSDGVCCDVKCGASSSDCRACAVSAGAAADGTCGPVQLAAAIVCRAAVGVCDAAEVCLGASQECPPDRAVPAGTACGAAAGECSLASECEGEEGATAACVARVAAAGTLCRKAAHGCDVAELCDGESAQCPPNEELSDCDGAGPEPEPEPAGGAGGSDAGRAESAGSGGTAEEPAGSSSNDSDGCSCRAAGQRSPRSGASLFALLGVAACSLLRRGRRQAG